MSKFDDVKEFYDATGQLRPAVPTRMRVERRSQIMQYLLSEVVEFGNARQLEDQVDAATDILFFVMDLFVELGVNPDVPFKLVWEANMRKIWPDGQAHWDHSVVPSRLLKPEGWEAPEPAIRDYLSEDWGRRATQRKSGD